LEEEMNSEYALDIMDIEDEDEFKEKYLDWMISKC